jgi:hypothetical protein
MNVNISRLYNIIDLRKQISIIYKRQIRKNHLLQFFRIEFYIFEISKMIVNLSLQFFIQSRDIFSRSLSWLNNEQQIKWCLELIN